MKKSQDINKKLVDLLLKKANGFHYVEEQFEYERDKTKQTKQQTENLNFFDICDRGKTHLENSNDMIELENETKKQGADDGLVLVKKKVATHYIPPDMLAIKILLEMFGKEELSDLEKMSDNELIELKKQLLEELRNEN